MEVFFGTTSFGIWEWSPNENNKYVNCCRHSGFHSVICAPFVLSLAGQTISSWHSCPDTVIWTSWNHMGGTMQGELALSSFILTKALRIIVWWWFSSITWLKKSLVQEREVEEEETLSWGWLFLFPEWLLPRVRDAFVGREALSRLMLLPRGDLAQIHVLWARGNCPPLQHCPGGPGHAGEQDLC